MIKVFERIDGFQRVPVKFVERNNVESYIKQRVSKMNIATVDTKVAGALEQILFTSKTGNRHEFSIVTKPNNVMRAK